LDIAKSMDLVELVREHLGKANPDMLRFLVEAFAKRSCPQRRTRSAGALAGRSPRSGRTGATATGPALGHEGSHHRAEGPQSARAATSPTGPWSAAAEPR
jgi:hypothetical protein